MIKKLFILVLLATAGYIAYLVWSNLTESERKTVKEHAGQVVDKVNQTAMSAAERITDSLRKNGDEPGKRPPSKMLDPPPGQPKKIGMPSR